MCLMATASEMAMPTENQRTALPPGRLECQFPETVKPAFFCAMASSFSGHALPARSLRIPHSDEEHQPHEATNTCYTYVVAAPIVRKVSSLRKMRLDKRPGVRTAADAPATGVAGRNGILRRGFPVMPWRLCALPCRLDAKCTLGPLDWARPHFRQMASQG